MWIYEHSDWPNFSWDAEILSSKLANIRHRQGYLLGKMEGLGFKLRREASHNILTSNVLKSSAIEGEFLNPDEVRSSIARHLGMDMAGLVPVGRDVGGIVDMMLDATEKFLVPLTTSRLFAWHTELFPTGQSGMKRIATGKWRTPNADPMQVVSGPEGHETVYFEAPAADRLEEEMRIFLGWIEGQDNLDPVLKSGIAHFWFVTIHPFEDGNGRIARAIGDMMLARADGSSERFYSLSSQIEAERDDYYNQLERQQSQPPDITAWLEWFLDCLDRAITKADETLAHIMFKAEFWETANQNPVNDRQKTVLNRMFEIGFEGYMNTSKYAGMAKCSTDTALRDIQALQSRGLLIRNSGGGRSVSYRLPEAGEMAEAYEMEPQ